LDKIEYWGIRRDVARNISTSTAAKFCGSTNYHHKQFIALQIKKKTTKTTLDNHAIQPKKMLSSVVLVVFEKKKDSGSMYSRKILRRKQIQKEDNQDNFGQD
jgi:hypothetical protein